MYAKMCLAGSLYCGREPEKSALKTKQIAFSAYTSLPQAQYCVWLRHLIYQGRCHKNACCVSQN